MHIQVLYFEQCPNYIYATANLRAALTRLGMEKDLEIEMTLLKTEQEAAQSHFVGSPTFIVGGHDLFGAPPDANFGIRCRIYLLRGQAMGVPLVEDFVMALEGLSKQTKQ